MSKPAHMIRLPLFIAAWLGLLAVSAQPAAALLPLQGTWEGTVGGERYVEQWSCAGDQCDGRATAYAGEVVQHTETMRIMQFAGHWHFLVWLGDGPAVAFTRTAANDTTWVFENKANDFPQRIRYTVLADTLKAQIAGPGKEGAMHIDFLLERRD